MLNVDHDIDFTYLSSLPRGLLYWYHERSTDILFYFHVRQSVFPFLVSLVRNYFGVVAPFIN